MVPSLWPPIPCFGFFFDLVFRNVSGSSRRLRPFGFLLRRPLQVGIRFFGVVTACLGCALLPSRFDQARFRVAIISRSQLIQTQVEFDFLYAQIGVSVFLRAV